jgi:hypothetical protein
MFGEIGLRVRAGETQRGKNLFDHETLPTATDQRLIIEMLDDLPIQDRAEGSAVAPVKAWCFDKSFGEVARPWMQAADQKVSSKKSPVVPPRFLI